MAAYRLKKIILLTTIVVFAFGAASAKAATRTISNAGGNWNSTSTWVEGVVPTSADNVVATATSGNLTINVSSSCNSFNLTNYTKTVTHNASVTLSIGSSVAGASNNALIFPSSGWTYTLGSTTTSAISFISTSTTAQNINFGGKTSGNVTFNGTGGSWLLTGNMNLGAASTLTLTAGTLNANGNNITTGIFSSGGITSRTFTMGTGILTLSGTGTVFSTSSSLTLNAGTSTISITDVSSNSKTFSGSGKTYYNLSIAGGGTGAVTLSGTGTNSFNNFTINAPKTITLPIVPNTTAITGTFTCTGSAGNIITINSSSSGTQSNLSKASGTVNCDYLSLQDSNATGGATWNAGANSTNVSGNSGWIFGSSGSLDHFAFSTVASPQTAGTAFNITITAQDMSNATVTGFTGSVNLTTTAGTISPANSGAFVSGVKTVSVTVTGLGTGKTITATDAGGTGKTGTSNTFTVNSGTLNNFLVEAAAGGNIGTQIIGSPFNIKITARDSSNNTVTSFSGTVTLSNTLGGMSPTTSGSFVAGVLSSQSITLSNAGTDSITATSGSTGTSNSFTVTVNNPSPTTTSISPSSATAGGATFTLTVNGTNIISSSTILWDGIAGFATTYVSSTQLTGSVPMSAISSGGSHSVTVVNPMPGGGTSNSQTFTVNNPSPTTTSISPSSATAGGAQFTLTVNGTNFVSSSVVNWNGSARTTTFFSSTQLTATILAGDIATAGTATVTVFNPTPGGGTSGSQTFTINAASSSLPTITSISQPSVNVGNDAFDEIFTGTNFNQNSIVYFWFTQVDPSWITSITSTAITIHFPQNSFQIAGIWNVTVYNPGIGTSNDQIFTVNSGNSSASPIISNFTISGNNCPVAPATDAAFFTWTDTSPVNDPESTFVFEICSDINCNSPTITVNDVSPLDYPSPSTNTQSVYIGSGQAMDFNHTYYLHEEVINQSNNSGWSSATPFTTSASPGPYPAFTYTVNGDTVSFTDASTGATSWLWNFGDNATSTLQNPTHTYAADGTYQVTVQVSDGSTTCQTPYPTLVQALAAAAQNVPMEIEKSGTDTGNSKLCPNFVTGNWDPCAGYQ